MTNHNLLITSLSAWTFFIYGIYTTLFSICTYILLKKRGTSYKYYLLANTLIFLLTCVFIALQVAVDTSQYLFRLGETRTLTPPRVLIFSNVISFSCSLITDTILICRCYTIWTKQWKAIVIPIILNFIAHICALVIICKGDLSPSWILVGSIVTGAIALETLLLSILIAFKILSIGRQVARSVGTKLRNMYRIIIASTLESGILYSTYLVVVTIIQGDTYRRYNSMSDKQFEVMNAAVQFLFNVWPCIAGITTTIIIVRVTLGIALNDAESEVISIRVAETARGPAVSELRREENLSQGDAVMVIARDEETGR